MDWPTKLIKLQPIRLCYWNSWQNRAASFEGHRGPDLLISQERRLLSSGTALGSNSWRCLCWGRKLQCLQHKAIWFRHGRRLHNLLKRPNCDERFWSSSWFQFQCLQWLDLRWFPCGRYYEDQGQLNCLWPPECESPPLQRAGWFHHQHLQRFQVDK